MTTSIIASTTTLSMVVAADEKECDEILSSTGVMTTLVAADLKLDF